MRIRRMGSLLHRGEKGFTLIELLVVVAILGVLVAIAIPNVINFIGEGEEQAEDETLHTVQLAVTSACTANALAGNTVFPLGVAADPDLDSGGCYATIAAGGTLEVGNFLIGGYAALEDAFDISDMGLVTYD